MLFCISCTQPAISTVAENPVKTDSQVDTFPPPIPPKPGYDYTVSRKKVEACRASLSKAYQTGQITLDSVGTAFTHCLLTEIFPHWYGTHWTFSGHTETPGQGDIACGYFVSTTLLHNGLNLNRYRLAQQSPADEALMLGLGDTVFVTRRDNAVEVLDLWRNKLRNGLYFIGLGEGHVGFLLKKKDRFYLIHSNYTYPVGVILQPVAESVLMGFQEFYLTNITFNRPLMECWLMGKKVPLQKETSYMSNW